MVEPTDAGPDHGDATAGRKVAVHGAIYLVGSILQRGFAFLILPVATRTLGPEEFGVLAIALAIATVLGTILPFGTNFAIVRLYFDEEEGHGPSEWAALVRVQLALSALAAVVLWSIGPLWGPLVSEAGWNPSLEAAVLLGFTLAGMSIAQSILRAQQRPRAFIGISLLQMVVGGGLALWLAREHDAVGYVLGMAVGTLLAMVVGDALTYRPANWQLSSIRAGLALSLPYLGHMGAGWVLNLADRLILAHHVPLDDLGSYQVAYTLGTAVFVVLDAAQAAFAPHFFGDLDSESKRRLPGGIAPSLTLAIGGLSLGVVALSPLLLAVAAPSSFDRAYPVVALVACAGLTRGVYLLGMVVITDTRRSGSIAVASVAAAATNVAANLVLIPILGLTGAGIATLVAYGVQSLLLARRSEPLLERPLLRSPTVVIMGGAALATVLAGVAVDAWPDPTTVVVLAPVAALLTVLGGMSLRRSYSALATG